MTTEYLSPQFALFNCHVNNAESKARALFIAWHGLEVWNAEIVPYLNRGVMSIFNEDPNKFTMWYVQCVWTLVNENKIPSEVI